LSFLTQERKRSLCPPIKCAIFATVTWALAVINWWCFGNATRCIGHIYMSEQGSEACAIETAGGLLHATLAGENLVTVNMGEPRDVRDLELSYAGLNNPVSVNMGNPHCVFITIHANGGDLQMEWREESGHIFMTGPVAYVFDGVLTT